MIRYYKLFSLVVIFLIANLDLAAKTKIVYACDQGYPPYEFSENGEAKGLNVDLMKAIAKEKKFDLEIILKPWEEITKLIDSGKVDVVAMYYTRERDKYYDFSIPFTMTTHSVYQRLGGPRISSPEDLNGKTVLIEYSSLVQNQFRKKIGNVKLKTLIDPQEGLRQIAAGNFEYAVAPKRLAGYFIQKNNIKNIVQTPLDIDQNRYCFTVKDGNYEALTLINEGLATIRQNGVYNDINEKWYGVLEQPKTAWTDIFYTSAYIIIPLIAFIAIIIFWNRSLKKQVKFKTKQLRNELNEKLLAHEKLFLFQFALDHSAESIFGYNKEGIIIYTNDAASTVFGFTKNELLNSHVSIIDSTYSPFSWEAFWNRGKKNGSFLLSYNQNRKNGEVFPLEGSACFFNFNGSEILFTFSRDITDKRLVQDALKNSEEQFRNMFEKHGSIMFFADPLNYDIIDANEAASKFYGYSRISFKRIKLTDLNHSDNATMRELHRKFNRDEKLENYETVHYMYDGTTRDVSISGVKISLSNKELLFFIVVDNTERNKFIETLKDSEEKFANAFTTIPDGVVITRFSDNVFVDANNEFFKVVGYTKDELQGKNSSDIKLWVDDKVKNEFYNALKSTKEAIGFEAEMRRQTGDIFIALVSSRILEYGESPKILTIIKDITERKSFEDEIANDKERLDTILKSIADGVIATDNAGVITFINPLAQQLTGYTEKEAIGSIIEEIYQIKHPESGESQTNQVRVALFSGVSSYSSTNFILVSKSGREFFVSDQASPIKNIEGEVIGSSLVFKDITKLVNTENELKKERDFSKTLFNNIGAIVIVVDRDYNIYEINREAELLTNFTNSEISGKSFFEVFATEKNIQEIRNTFDTIKAGVFPFSYETSIKTGNDDLLLISWKNTAILDKNDDVDYIICMGVDISEKHEIEVKNAELASRYEIIVTASGQVAYEYDIIDDKIDWGGSIQSVLGYTVEQMGVKTKDWYEKIHRDDLQLVLAKLEKCKKNAELFFAEYRIRNNFGDYVWISETGQFFMNDARESVKMYGMIQYIDTKKKEEKYKSALYKIAESASGAHNIQILCEQIHKIIDELMPAQNLYIALYDDVSETFTYPYFVDEYDDADMYTPTKRGRGLTELVIDTGEALLVDPEAFYDLVSEGKVDLVGAPSIDWLGAPLKYNEKIIGALVVQSYVEGVRYNKEHKNILSFVSNQIAMAIEHKRTQEALLEAFEDLENRVEERTVQLSNANEELQTQIEERIRIEYETRESEERFRLMADSSPVMIWMTNQIGEMIYMNQTWLNYTGSTIHEALGAGWKSKTHPSDLQNLNAMFIEAIKYKKSFAGEFKFLHISGEYRFLSFTAVPRLVNEKEFYGFIGSCIDITELKTALDREKEINYMKTRFISTVSHEYRTPLTTILTSTYLISTLISKGEFDQAQKFIERIRLSVKNMTNLLDQVLTISRADAGKIKVEPEVFNIKEFVDSIFEEIALFDKGAHSLSCEIELENPEVTLDANLLHQITINLATNAVKYSPDKTDIIVRIKESSEKYFIDIIDSGCGIPFEQQKHLFEPFFRAANVGAIQGTGLGLSIVKRCLDVLAGEIEMNSVQDVGTTFTITLPKNKLLD